MTFHRRADESFESDESKRGKKEEKSCILEWRMRDRNPLAGERADTFDCRYDITVKYRINQAV